MAMWQKVIFLREESEFAKFKTRGLTIDVLFWGDSQELHLILKDAIENDTRNNKTSKNLMEILSHFLSLDLTETC